VFVPGPVPSFTCTNETCTYTGKPIEFGPKAPVCTKAEGSMPATMCDPKQRTVNTQAKCGSPDDFFYYSPWRAPGYAPVIDSCGSAGGRIPGQGAGGFGATYTNTTNAKLGDLGSQTLQALDGPEWVAGGDYEVAWTLQANHGGGYSYRLCPADSKLDEDCFNQSPLEMVGQSKLRWGGEGGHALAYDPVTVTEGTKAGVMWRKNPIPRAWKTKAGAWGKGSNHLQTGWGFDPVCIDHGEDQQGTTRSCTGEWGPYNMEIVDTVRIPKDLKPGKWVLNWRLDCEESNQIWQSCSDLSIQNAAH
jgi:lytic starch monooxygenase